jgi:biotin synthase
MNGKIEEIADCCLTGGDIAHEQIGTLLAQAETSFFDLLYWANKIREKFFGNKVRICSIVPGRLGGCNQDCKFCAQSARYNTDYRKTQTLSDEEILAAAEQAESNGVTNFGIVYSGKTINGKELARLEGLIAEIKEYFDVKVSSERHFANIVTTHEYADRVGTIEAAKQAGLRVCAGGIFGVDESDDDRVQMALELRRLDVDIVPMNFLHPIEGTPLADTETLEPKKILQIIALYRFILPQTTLKVAGGRVLNLRDLQSWIFYAGANAILSGNYLTTSGRAVGEDMQMLTDLGLEPDSD